MPITHLQHHNKHEYNIDSLLNIQFATMLGDFIMFYAHKHTCQLEICPQSLHLYDNCGFAPYCACRWGHFHEASYVNSWFHHHTFVAVFVVHGLEITGVKVDAEHMPWLASHRDPQLPHFVPILSTHQPGRTQQWGECSIINHNPQRSKMAQRITTCCCGPG